MNKFSTYEELIAFSELLENSPVVEPRTLKVPDWAYPSLMEAIQRVGYKVVMPLEPLNYRIQKG